MGRKVNVIGVGMVKFAKPGQSEDYNVMAAKAIKAALADGGVAYDEVEQAVAGYVFGDSTCGQRAVYDVGLTGIPVYNVNNNCSTGSSALMLAKQLVEGGIVECALAVGFEQMQKGALGSAWNDRPNPLGLHVNVMNETQGFTSAPPAAQMFGGAGREYRWKYGAKRETFAKVNAKARQHAAKNPYALFRDLLTVEDLAARFQVRKRKVYDLVRDAGLPHLRVGRALRFRARDVDRWLTARTGVEPIPGAAAQRHPDLPAYDWSKSAS